MNHDQVKGAAKQVKGQIKETTGRILGDKTLEKKGAMQIATGKLQKGFGDAKEATRKGS
jgi:uncharacterized protein YjbJ (UPF0337 family)